MVEGARHCSGQSGSRGLSLELAEDLGGKRPKGVVLELGLPWKGECSLCCTQEPRPWG